MWKRVFNEVNVQTELLVCYKRKNRYTPLAKQFTQIECVCVFQSPKSSQLHICTIEMQLVFNTVNNFNLCLSHIKLVVFQVFGHAELFIKSKMTHISWFCSFLSIEIYIMVSCCEFVPIVSGRCIRVFVFQLLEIDAVSTISFTIGAVYGLVIFDWFPGWNIAQSFNWLSRLACLAVHNRYDAIAC